jgi:hypothetical protein
MPQSKYFYKFQLITPYYDRKYKCITDLINDVGKELNINNRNTVYRIFTKKSHTDTQILKIKEKVF